MGCKAGQKILVREVVGPSREAIAAASAVAVVIFFFFTNGHNVPTKWSSK